MRRLSLVLLVALLLLLVPLGGCSIGSPASNQADVLDQMASLAPLIEAPDVRAEDVSGWSVHQQAEHVLRANEGILGLIEAAEEPETVEPFSTSGRWVLWWGGIPRGRGQAPEVTVPEDLSPAELQALHGRVVEAVRALDLERLESEELVVGNHPYFGGMTAHQWLRFMGVHGAHHGAIMADIVDAAAEADA